MRWTAYREAVSVVCMDQGIIALLSGFGLCLGLILSIGAQNAVVLRQGLRREHVGIVVLVCVVSDAILQAIGVAGVATLVTAPPVARDGRPLGGRRLHRRLRAAERATRVARRRLARGGARRGPGCADGGRAGVAVATRRRSGRLATLATILAVTWLNPHAIVETTVVLGSVAATHGDARWWFLAGGIAASTLWFVGFGYGARFLAPLLRTERAWRILDGTIAAIMLVIAVTLVTG